MQDSHRYSSIRIVADDEKTAPELLGSNGWSDEALRYDRDVTLAKLEGTPSPRELKLLYMFEIAMAKLFRH